MDHSIQAYLNRMSTAQLQALLENPLEDILPDIPNMIAFVLQERKRIASTMQTTYTRDELKKMPSWELTVLLHVMLETKDPGVYRDSILAISSILKERHPPTPLSPAEQKRLIETYLRDYDALIL